MAFDHFARLLGKPRHSYWTAIAAKHRLQAFQILSVGLHEAVHPLLVCLLLFTSIAVEIVGVIVAE
jgi:hypothetical protein